MTRYTPPSTKEPTRSSFATRRRRRHRIIAVVVGLGLVLPIFGSLFAR